MLLHTMHELHVQSRVFTPRHQMPRRCGETKTKHTQSTPGSPGPIWHCRGPPSHDNDTGDVTIGQCWSRLFSHRVCKVEFSLLDPRCRVGVVIQRKNTRNSQLALQGPFGTAEGRPTMTTTTESSLEVNAGPHHARTACAKSIFHSLAPDAASMRRNQDITHVIHTWLSRAHLALPRAAKP